MPDKLRTAVMRKHGMSQTDDDEDESGFWDVGYWDASWDLMDLAQVHWDSLLLRCGDALSR